MCVAARSPVVVSNPRVPSASHRVIIPHRRRHRRVRAPMDDANARDEFRAHHPRHHARHRTLARASIARMNASSSMVRPRERTNDPIAPPRLVATARTSVRARARAYTLDKYVSTRASTDRPPIVDRRSSRARVVQLCRRTTDDVTFRSFKSRTDRRSPAPAPAPAPARGYFRDIYAYT